MIDQRSSMRLYVCIIPRNVSILLALTLHPGFSRISLIHDPHRRSLASLGRDRSANI